MFSFNIKKPDDITATLKAVEHKIKSSGGAFSGDEQSGSFTNSKRDVVGRYFVEANGVKITIVKKPLIYPYSAVESRIREYFEQ